MPLSLAEPSLEFLGIFMASQSVLFEANDEAGSGGFQSSRPGQATFPKEATLLAGR